MKSKLASVIYTLREKPQTDSGDWLRPSQTLLAVSSQLSSSGLNPYLTRLCLMNAVCIAELPPDKEQQHHNRRTYSSCLSVCWEKHLGEASNIYKNFRCTMCSNTLLYYTLYLKCHIKETKSIAFNVIFQTDLYHCCAFFFYSILSRCMNEARTVCVDQ